MNEPAQAATLEQLDARSSRLKITEIFRSLQGEARDAGWPTTFIRLSGCPLRCHYCDTAYAFHGGQWHELEAVLQHPLVQQSQHICVTGGEPLAQKACRALLHQLCERGYRVSLETSGAMDISQIDLRVSRVVDIKTPDSGEHEGNLWGNLSLLTPHDQIKFVICSRQDFDWAIQIIDQYQLINSCDIWMSPSFAQVNPVDLSQWVLDSGRPLRFQLQLHKLLWNDEPGR